MKKNLGLIILILIMSLILGLIIYTIVTKQNLDRDLFNIKVGDNLSYIDDEVNITILHLGYEKCENQNKCKYNNIEVSLSCKYNDTYERYTLDLKDNSKQRIKNSNYYIILTYENDEIKIDVKDKNDL